MRQRTYAKPKTWQGKRCQKGCDQEDHQEDKNKFKEKLQKACEELQEAREEHQKIKPQKNQQKTFIKKKVLDMNVIQYVVGFAFPEIK